MFLIAFGKAATNEELDFAAAVSMALSGSSGSPPLKGGGGEAKEEAKEGSPSSKSSAPPSPSFEGQNLADRPMFGDEGGGKADKDRAQTRSGTRGRDGSKSNREQATSDAGLGDEGGSPGKATTTQDSSSNNGGNGNSNLDQLIEECNSDFNRTREVMEKLVAKPKCSEKLLSKPPFRFLHDVVSAVVKATGFGEGVYTEEEMDSGNVKDKASKCAYLEKILKHVGSNLNTFVDARPAKIVAGLEPENTSTFLQLLALAATLHIESENGGGGGGGGGGGDGGNNGEEKENHNNNSRPEAKMEMEEAQQKRPSPEKQRVEAAPAKEEAPQAKADDKPATTTTASSNNDDSSEPKQKSMRPSTARRRPPKVKENAAVEVRERSEASESFDRRAYGPLLNYRYSTQFVWLRSAQAKEVAKEKIVKATILKEGEGKDAFFDDDDDNDNENGNANLGANNVSDASLQGKQHGKLIQNIMSEQEVSERALSLEEKTKILAMNPAKWLQT